MTTVSVVNGEGGGVRGSPTFRNRDVSRVGLIIQDMQITFNHRPKADMYKNKFRLHYSLFDGVLGL